MRAILYDDTKCVGCGACMAACREKNGLPETDAPELTDKQFTVVKTIKSKEGDVSYRRMCMHCVDPTCASVCPVGALHKTANGPVVYNPDICLGCRYCIQACPFGVPKYEWNKLAPRVQKCTMCPDRVQAGKPTACAEICPTGATKFGERDELIAEARQRIRDNPGQYVDHIYGVNEVGGTSVLLLSSVPFEEFGYRADLTRDPLPIYTYRVLSRIPDFVPLGGMVLGGIWWITHRREEVAAAEEGHKPELVARKESGK
jgi:formate dehydrogenase iron-sulfur subunit